VSFFTTRHRLFAPGPHRVVVWSPPPGEGHDVPALLGTSALAFPQAALACAATPAAVARLRTPEGGAGAVPVRWDAIDAAPGPRWAGAEYGRWRRASRWYVEARAAAVAFEAELILLAAEDGQRDISLYINSPGGSVSAGLAIYDVMQFVPNDIRTYAMGMAASMGQFLLCAGTHGKRYALPHAQILLHQPHGGVGGTETDIRIQAKQILTLKKVLADRTAFHTGQTVERIEADSDRDRWFSADEAKDYGLVDHVVRSANEVPSEGPVS